MKKCNKCSRIKPPDEFYRDASTKDGLFTQCIECKKQYCRDNRNKIKIKQREYRIKNKDIVNKRARLYRKKIDELAKIWHKESPGIAFSEWRRIKKLNKQLP